MNYRDPLFLILLDAILLAAGILIILVVCFQYNNFFPLFTILANSMAILQLMMCGACSGRDAWSGGGDDDTGKEISWLMFGLFSVFGYATLGLLYRAGIIPDVALYMGWGGGSIILAAMIIYLRAIYQVDNN